MTQTNYSEIRLRPNDIALAYLLLRIVFGINFFVHGLVRINNIPGFVQSQVDLYQELPIPPFMVAGPAFLIPIVELVVGFLLILGLQTRIALIAGSILMMFLMFGVCLLQMWDAAGSQLIYCLIYFILLVAHQYDWFSIDRMRKGR